MAGTCIGAAIDYLVAGLPTVLSEVAATVVVADNEPGTESDTYFIVGRQAPTVGVAGTAESSHVTLGALRVDERWALDWWIECSRPGPAQKPARDAAVAIYDRFVQFLQTDLTFGGITLGGGYVQISRVQLYQTQDATDVGAGGQRLARISGELTLTSRYSPG